MRPGSSTFIDVPHAGDMGLYLFHCSEIWQAWLAIVLGSHRSPVNSPHKGRWRGPLMLCLICAWINGWVNNGEAGDLRLNRAHHCNAGAPAKRLPNSRAILLYSHPILPSRNFAISYDKTPCNSKYRSWSRCIDSGVCARSDFSSVCLYLLNLLCWWLMSKYWVSSYFMISKSIDDNIKFVHCYRLSAAQSHNTCSRHILNRKHLESECLS